MPFKIVRNDITKMHCDAIVNTANEFPRVDAGCDTAVYAAAGREKLLAYRRDQVGRVEEGEVFVTPAFDLDAKCIIHAVSPCYRDGQSGEEEKLRSCYKKSLQLAYEKGVKSIAFPLISTGSFGYPKEEGMRIAIDEFNAFLLRHEMLIYLVVFDSQSTELGERIYPDLEAYIDHNYVQARQEEEYGNRYFGAQGNRRPNMPPNLASRRPMAVREASSLIGRKAPKPIQIDAAFDACPQPMAAPSHVASGSAAPCPAASSPAEDEDFDFCEEHESKLQERMKHMSDTFSEYLLYLIEDKGMTNAQVYNKALVDKKVFSKIKNNPDYHPQKLTAMCLCVGARLNLDETRDLLARAGYALSPCDKTDVIFSYFIENGIYDMIELDIQLEEHGLKCIIA